MATPISRTGSDTALLHQLLEHVREHALFEVDAGGLISSWNPSIGRMFGYSEVELKAADFGLLLPPDRRDPETIAGLLRRAGQVGRLQEKLALRRKNGQVFQAVLVISIIPGTECYGIVVRDMAVLLATHEQFHALATIDQITGLANRQHLFDLGRVEYRRWRRYKVPLSLVMVTIDNYEQMTVSHGHEVCDGVLRDMADLLKQAVRDVDLAAHLEGAEFVVLLPNTTQEGAAVLAERIRKFLNRSAFTLNGAKQFMSGSAAVLTANGNVVDFDDFITQARTSVVQARALGGDRIIVA